MKEYVIQELSNTQKIMLMKDGDSWFISKMWRHNLQDTWKIGKGIMLPPIAIGNLITVLKENYHEYVC